MKKKIIGIFLAVFLLFGVTSCVSDSGVITKVSEEAEYTKIENEITDVYAKVSKGCVGLAVTGNNTSASGSGVIYKYDEEKSLYYVVTNAHVVENMTSCKIYLGGIKYNSAKIVGYDKKNDIAVVTFSLDFMNSAIKDNIYVNDIYNYEENDVVTVGQTVLAIGCPLGLDNYNILTTGVVSSVNKLQISTDAALNPGNSGGGLFNLDGRLIGINTEKEVWDFDGGIGGTYITGEDIPVEGRGYAVPLSLVKNCIDNIVKKNGIVERPLLGITVKTINTLIEPNNEYKNYLPVIDESVFFIVTSFNSIDSAAKLAGIKQFDVILEVNGKIIQHSNDISSELNFLTMNDSITLKIYRLELSTPVTKEITITFK